MSPFRQSYLRYEELTRIVHDWARAHPDFVRVASIGSSTEGRELWLLEIGREPDRRRAAAWVDGNMHAVELCGSSVALAIAEDVIALHRGEDRHDLPAHVRERLRVPTAEARVDGRLVAHAEPAEEAVAVGLLQ